MWQKSKIGKTMKEGYFFIYVCVCVKSLGRSDMSHFIASMQSFQVQTTHFLSLNSYGGIVFLLIVG